MPKLFSLLLIVTIFSSCVFGQMTDAYRQKILNDHNEKRRGETNAANMLELVYDYDLEVVAQNYLATQGGSFSHNSGRSSQYKAQAGLTGNVYVGENWYSGGPTDAVEKWTDFRWPVAWGGNGCSERENYEGTCNGVDGHFTQVIWAKSGSVGCGYTSSGGTLCNYYFGGNYNGEAPFVQGSQASQCPSGTYANNGLCSSGTATSSTTSATTSATSSTTSATTSATSSTTSATTSATSSTTSATTSATSSTTSATTSATSSTTSATTSATSSTTSATTSATSSTTSATTSATTSSTTSADPTTSSTTSADPTTSSTTSAAPEPTQAPEPSTNLDNWIEYLGSLSSWSRNSNELIHTGNEISALYLRDSAINYGSNIDNYVIVKATPSSSEDQYGFLVHRNGGNGLLIGREGNSVRAWWRYPYYGGAYTHTSSGSSPVNEQVVFKARIYSAGSTRYINFMTEDNSYTFTTGWGRYGSNVNEGDLGIFASGDVSFEDFIVIQPSYITLELADCSATSEESITELIQSTVGSTDIEIVDFDLQCGSKRAAGVATFGVVATSAPAFTGATLSSSVAAASVPVASLAAGAPFTVTATGGSVAVVGVASASGSTLIAAAIASAAVIAVPLSIIAIVAIAGGSVVAVGVAGGITAAVVNGGDKKDEEEIEISIQHEEPIQFEEPAKVQQPVQQPVRKVSRGVDIFTMDPNSPQSLTARSPAIKHVE